MLSYCFQFGLLTKRKYVYILLIMKEQHHQEVNMAKVLEVASFCACANLRKTSRAVTQLYDESLHSSESSVGRRCSD